MPVLQTQLVELSTKCFGGGVLLIDRFHELSDDQRHALYPLDLFLRPDELTLQTPGRLLSVNGRKASEISTSVRL